jgi:hypothetical protein
MKTQTQIESELLGLIEFIESGLLTPSLRRHLAEFPTRELKIAAGDLLDWLSLRAILRDRVHRVRGRASPRVEGLLQCLPETFHHVCVQEGCLAYRAAITPEQQHALEDFVKECIWHPDAGRERQKSPVR